MPGIPLGVVVADAQFPAMADRARVGLEQAGKLHLGQAGSDDGLHVVKCAPGHFSGRFELGDLPGGFDASNLEDERRAVDALPRLEKIPVEAEFIDRKNIHFQPEACRSPAVNVGDQARNGFDAVDGDNGLDTRLRAGAGDRLLDEQQRLALRRQVEKTVLGRTAEIEEVYALDDEEPVDSSSA